MPAFGTIEIFQELATALNCNPEWETLGKGVSCSMVYVYSEPINKAFFLRFDQGRVTDVHEGSAAEESADFVLSADPETWRAILEKRMKPFMALTRGKVKLDGNMTALMKHMKAFNYVLDSMTAVELT